MMRNLIKMPAAGEALPRAEISIGPGALAHEKIGIKKTEKGTGNPKEPRIFRKNQKF